MDQYGLRFDFYGLKIMCTFARNIKKAKTIKNMEKLKPLPRKFISGM